MSSIINLTGPQGHFYTTFLSASFVLFNVDCISACPPHETIIFDKNALAN